LPLKKVERSQADGMPLELKTYLGQDLINGRVMLKEEI